MLKIHKEQIKPGTLMLKLKGDSIQMKLVGKALLICRFEQSGTQKAMYFDGTSNYFSCKRIFFHYFSVRSVFSVVT